MSKLQDLKQQNAGLQGELTFKLAVAYLVVASTSSLSVTRGTVLLRLALNGFGD